MSLQASSRCSVFLDPGGADEAEQVAAVFDWLASDLVAVYLHGSAVLGGFGPASDLDVLAVVRKLASVDMLAQKLLSLSLAHPLELSVVRAADARQPSSPWPYLLHVNGKDMRWQVDAGQGDPDLISHYVVTRARGMALRGLTPVETIGEIPKDIHRSYLAEELAWAVAHADARYGVLNAARACAWLQDGLILSKIEGARWWLTTYGSNQIVRLALQAQIFGRDLGSCSPAQADFIGAVQELLDQSPRVEK